jgi:hypothetical protein
VKTYGYLILALFVAFLLSLNSYKLFTLDDISLFITVIGLIYGLMAAFTINNAWERFSKIRDAIAQEVDGLITMWIYTKHMSDKKSIEEIRKLIIEYCDEAPRIEWDKYLQSVETHKKFHTLIDLISEMKIKNQKDALLFAELSEELRSATTGRNAELILASTKVSPMQWTLNIFLSVILIIGLTLLSLPSYTLTFFIVTTMVAAIIMILCVIYELDKLKYAEKETFCDPYAQVIRVVSKNTIEPDINAWWKGKSGIPPQT